MRAKRKTPAGRIACVGGPMDGLSISDKYGPRTPFATREPPGEYQYEGTTNEGKYVWRAQH